MLVGQIGAAHGVRGQVKVRSFMQEPEALSRFGPLCDASGRVKFEMTLLRPLKLDQFIASIAGVHSREQAQKLTNTFLYLERARLPEPSEDEFYHADLIGLEAQDKAGRRIGTVVAVHDFGAGAFLEIAREDGGEMLAPFTSRAIVAIEPAKTRIVLDPPAESEADSDENGFAAD